jgi:hypothetical protein
MDFANFSSQSKMLFIEVMVWILLLPKTLIRPCSGRGGLFNMSMMNGKEARRPLRRVSIPVLLWLIVAVLPLTVSTLVQNGNIKTIQDVVRALHDGLLSQTLYAMIIPFTYITWMEWMSNRSIKKSTLSVRFYIHCYALAPAQFIYGAFAILTIWNPLLFSSSFSVLSCL